MANGPVQRIRVPETIKLLEGYGVRTTTSAWLLKLKMLKETRRQLACLRGSLFSF
jgi:hypothetical protein